jgi:hypothetical protein
VIEKRIARKICWKEKEFLGKQKEQRKISAEDRQKWRGKRKRKKRERSFLGQGKSCFPDENDVFAIIKAV